MSDPKSPSGAAPEDLDKTKGNAPEDQLDEALEDTFPASDPIAAEEPGPPNGDAQGQKK